MNEKRILSLDISTKTGYCLLISMPSGPVLEEYGQTSKISCPEGDYPSSFVDWAYQCFAKVLEIISRLKPDILIIEETAANSKSSHSQKILEFIHFLVAQMIRDTGIQTSYLMTGQWRSIVESKMTKEERDQNKQIKKYKLDNNTKLAYSSNGKRLGKITKKHVSIRKVKELFGIDLKLKDNDTSDAILLAYAHYLKDRKRNL